MAAPASASSSSSSSSGRQGITPPPPPPPVERWEHLIAGARQAAHAHIATDEMEELTDDATMVAGEFASAFREHIVQAMPDLAPEESDRVRLISRLDWYAGRVVDGGGGAAARDLFFELARVTYILDTPESSLVRVYPIDLDTDLHPRLAYVLRFLHARYPPLAWRAMRAWMVDRVRRMAEYDMDDEEDEDDPVEPDDLARLYAFRGMMQDVDGDATPLMRAPDAPPVASPPAAAAGVKRDRGAAAAAAASALPRRANVAPWDSRFDEARLAADQAAREAVRTEWVETDYDRDNESDAVAMPAYMRAFKAAIHAAFPDADRANVATDAQVAWELRVFEQTHTIDDIYERLVRSSWVRAEGARIILRLRRIHVHGHAAWTALAQRIASHARDAPAYAFEWQRRVAVEDALLLRSHVQRAMQPDVDRGHFDASQVERHMSMAHRVPADVSNLIGQFATTAITPRAPVPLRLQVKHKLELLARRVAFMTAAQVAAELRDIVADVNAAAAAPDGEHTPAKKARK